MFVTTDDELPNPHSRSAVRLPSAGALREQLERDGQVILDDGTYRILVSKGEAIT